MARRASSITASSSARLAVPPSPLMLLSCSALALSKPAMPPQCSSTSCAMMRTLRPAVPVRRSRASSSASLKAAAPRARSFSRGMASGGRWVSAIGGACVGCFGGCVDCAGCGLLAFVG